ncbi:uncharacterized protein LOC123508485 [Portunus trituberculatus]|uniref:uncharacterized protein LOC123508485 n=1 Tax=Portunus trituberculatus TaxID=210409 RepID=UPI001E1D189D|nr:uncharacterized protein LOC123508485 [Portunus trituberculatus]
MQVDVLPVDIPAVMEIVFLRVILADESGLLLCAAYRPQWQGNAPLNYLSEHLDDIMAAHNCQHVVIVGDLNQHLVMRAFTDLTVVQGLHNHVNFPTHQRGGSLDPVLSDLPEACVMCRPLDRVGSSDHYAVLSSINLSAAREEEQQRVIWLWERADWEAMKRSLSATDWHTVLTGDPHHDTIAFTTVLLSLQQQFVPHRVYTTNPKDQQWFGYQCRVAADNKYRAWQHYKRHPTQVDAKQWWNLVKERQGISHQVRIPALTKPNGDLAVTSREKADLLAAEFSRKMTTGDPNRQPPALPVLVPHPFRMLSLLKMIPPRTHLPAVPADREWPSLWKEARITPVHKKRSRAEPGNYRPISLLSVVSKIFERIIGEQINKYLEENHLLSPKQFGFRKGRSTSDLLLLLSKSWHDALDAGRPSLVIALDIAGAFDSVWHHALTTKLQQLGITGDLLQLFTSYLTGRSLRVVVNGSTSSSFPVEASVPQGSVLGPILWNIYFNDLLQSSPEAAAYADDCTLSWAYERGEAQNVVQAVNRQLQDILAWGERWQVKFAPEKTQAMVITRSQGEADQLRGKLRLGPDTIPLQDTIEILGVEVDSRLQFDRHLEKVARNASSKVNLLRRMKHLLHADGLLTLYKAQRQQEEQQRHDLRDSLEHRRRVAALTVLHKAQVQRVPHLTDLGATWRRHEVGTRTVSANDLLLEVPRSHSSTHQRAFTSAAVVWWNELTTDVDVRGLSTQQIKVAAHRWLRLHPP